MYSDVNEAGGMRPQCTSPFTIINKMRVTDGCNKQWRQKKEEKINPYGYEFLKDHFKALQGWFSVAGQGEG